MLTFLQDYIKLEYINDEEIPFYLLTVGHQVLKLTENEFQILVNSFEYMTEMVQATTQKTN